MRKLLSSLSVSTLFNINLKIRFLFINNFLIGIKIIHTLRCMISIIFSIIINITVFFFLFRYMELFDIVNIILFFDSCLNIGLFLWVYNLSEGWSWCFYPAFNLNRTSSISFNFNHILIILRIKLIEYIVFNILFIFHVDSCLQVVINLRWLIIFIFFIHFYKEVLKFYIFKLIS